MIKTTTKNRSGITAASVTVAVVLLMVVGLSVYFTYVSSGNASGKWLDRLPSPSLATLSNRAKKTIESCEESVRIRPDDASGWGLLGRAYLAHYLHDEARQCFAVAKELEPTNFQWPYSMMLAINPPDTKQSIELVKESLEHAAGNTDLQCRLAELFFEDSQFELAKATTERVLNTATDSPRANMLLARILLAENKAEESLEKLQIVMLTQPQRLEALRLASQLYFRLGQASKANEFAEKAEQPGIGNDPWFDPVFEDVQSLRRDVNILVRDAMQLPPSQIHRRIQILREAVDEEPQEPNWHGFLGQTLLQVKQFTEAKKILMNAITLHPNSPVLRYLLGLVFIQQKEFDSAAETFKKAISIKPDYDDAYLNLGIAQRTSQKLPEAIVSFEKAIDIFPGNLRAYLNLAVTLEMAQENQRAVDTYEKCLTIREDSAEIHFMLGSLQARLYREGQTVSDDRPENAKHAAQAREHLQRSLDLDPSQSEIPDMLNKLK